MPARALPQRGGLRRPARPPRRRRFGTVWLLLAIFGGAVASVLLLMVGALLLTFASGILPGVVVGDVNLGGLNVERATQRLQTQWDTVVLRDGERVWQVAPATLGVSLDATATAQLAYRQGRSKGNSLQALLGRVQVTPIIAVDADTARLELERIAQQVAIAPVNAGVALEAGRAVPTPPRNGRALDVGATLALLQGAGLNGQTLPLAMREVAPEVLDASPLVAQANALLSNPLDVRVFDPVTGDSIYWSVAPQQWGSWLSAAADPASPIGLSLRLQNAPLRDYLAGQATTVFDPSRTIDLDDAVRRVQQALADGQPQQAAVVVEHLPRTHTVAPGQTLTSIAWDYGMPYLYVQQANGGLTSLSVGQQITIPPADTFLKLPVVPDKRIVVSIREQRTRVYENGQLIWDWPASTGINDSPTWPGVYQVISHEINAYAGNWNLWMPHFLGVYQPVPGSDFTNGFHGFPTRGGGQLLWENSLGRRVTYGCILLSSTNAQRLYDWAEEGVVVEIRA